MVVGGADLREIEAAVRPVLAVQRQVGAVDQDAKRPMRLQPLRSSAALELRPYRIIIDIISLPV